MDPRAARIHRHRHRLLRRRPDHRRRGLRQSLSQQHPARESLHHSAHHGKRRRQPHLARDRRGGAYLHHLHRLLFFQSRHRTGFLDGAERRRGHGHRGRKRGRLQPRIPESLGSDARGLARYLPSVFEGPARPDPGRRRRHAGAGAARCRRAPVARTIYRRNRRLRHVVGRVPHHPAFARRRRSRHARRALPMPAWSRTESATSTRTAPRRWPTMPPKPRPSARSLARTPIGWRSVPRNPCTATRSARPAPSKPSPRCWRCDDRILPPTANFTEPDPSLRSGRDPQHARPAHVEFALSNSFAFGGLNAVLAFRRAGA